MQKRARIPAHLALSLYLGGRCITCSWALTIDSSRELKANSTLSLYSNQLLGGAEQRKLVIEDEPLGKAIQPVYEHLISEDAYGRPVYNQDEPLLDVLQDEKAIVMAYLSKFDEVPHYETGMSHKTQTSLLKNIYLTMKRRKQSLILDQQVVRD